MRSPLRRALAVPLCLAAVVVAACAEPTAPSQSDVPALLRRVPGAPSMTWDYSVSQHTPSPVAGEIPPCPSSGSFYIWNFNNRYGPFTINPLWSDCRDFTDGPQGEKQFLYDTTYWQLWFKGNGCEEIAMELYQMLYTNRLRFSQREGYPHFPSPFQDVNLFGSTHSSLAPYNEPISIVSEQAVYADWPGAGVNVIVHEVIHAWAAKNNVSQTESETVQATSFCLN